MVDDELRALLGRWRSSGDPLVGADYLRGLVRAGCMSDAQLRVAALCGHASARRAVEGTHCPTSPIELMLALREFGPQVYVRAAIAALESARGVAKNGTERLDVVPLLERWLEAPTEELARLIGASPGYRGGPMTVGGAVAAARWASEQHKFDELGKRDTYVDPAQLVEQEKIVRDAICKACLAWAFAAPW